MIFVQGPVICHPEMLARSVLHMLRRVRYILIVIYRLIVRDILNVIYRLSVRDILILIHKLSVRDILFIDNIFGRENLNVRVYP